MRALKGEGRPLNDEAARAGVVAALECVEHVVIFPEVRAHLSAKFAGAPKPPFPSPTEIPPLGGCGGAS